MAPYERIRFQPLLPDNIVHTPARSDVFPLDAILQNPNQVFEQHRILMLASIASVTKKSML
jgi:hypothetical protein